MSSINSVLSTTTTKYPNLLAGKYEISPGDWQHLYTGSNQTRSQYWEGEADTNYTLHQEAIGN